MSRKKGAGPNWCHYCQKKLQLRPGSRGEYYFTELLTPHDHYLVRTHNVCVENALKDGYLDKNSVKAKVQPVSPPAPAAEDMLTKEQVMAILRELQGERSDAQFLRSLGEITHTTWWRAKNGGTERLPKKVLELVGLQEVIRYTLKK